MSTEEQVESILADIESGKIKKDLRYEDGEVSGFGLAELKQKGEIYVEQD